MLFHAADAFAERLMPRRRRRAVRAFDATLFRLPLISL